MRRLQAARDANHNTDKKVFRAALHGQSRLDLVEFKRRDENNENGQKMSVTDIFFLLSELGQRNLGKLRRAFH